MKFFLNALRLAARDIRRHKTRAALTVLGIVIGVAAVVTVTALASAARAEVGDRVDRIAANALYISPRSTQQSGARGKVGGHLTEMDARAIAREAPSVEMTAVLSDCGGTVVNGDRNLQTQLMGCDLPYFPIRKWRVAKGELWTESDELLKNRVCILGASVADKLFGTEDPLGKTVRVGAFPFRVIGVFVRRGIGPWGDQDDRIMMPIGTYRARFAPTSPGRVDVIQAGATSALNSQRAKEQITAILRQRHHIPAGTPSDFVMSAQDDARQAQEKISSTLSALLIGVAAISLLVGGVGVMNIMLVTITERTREIGIRVSIGARYADILLQFLVEATLLSLLGGVLGAIVGVVGTMILGHALDWKLVPNPTALLVALGTSVTIGLVFGSLPAHRAARMDPIEALRTE